MNKKLLVVVPYRNREDHLIKFIPYIKQKLTDQDIEHLIVVVEQKDHNLFNRGLLCNIGYDQFYKNYDYICFHDVDMLCDTDYSYSDIPLSLLRKRTKIDHIFDAYFGGVTLFPTHIFKQINGFSNEYKGWGAEDDDLRLRCLSHNIDISHRNGFCEDLELVPENTNRKNNPHYQMNLNKLIKLQKQITYDTSMDGLSSLNSFAKVIKIINNNTYTLIQCQTL